MKLQDSWAICRILKKTNTTALRAISHSFVSSLPQEARTETKPYEEPLNTDQIFSNKILKNSSCFEILNENMNVAQPHSYFDNKETTMTSTCTTTTSPFSYLDFTSSDSPGPCLDQKYLRSLFLLASQDTQPPQFPTFINNNDMISSFLLNMSSSSSDSSFLGEYASHLDSNIDLTSAMLAQEKCPALVSLPQEYNETGFEGNIGGANQDQHHHALCHAFKFGDLSSTSTIVGDQLQNQNHHMLMESYYSSLSSVNDDLPVSFSIT